MTLEEVNSPPEDRATRLRRAKELGAEADYLARKDRELHEQRYKRWVIADRLAARAVDEIDQEFGA